MTISLVFIVAFLSLLLLPVTCLSILLSLLYTSRQQEQRHHHHYHPTSISSLFLWHTVFSNHAHDLQPTKIPSNKEVAPVRRYRAAGGRTTTVEADDVREECAVCLSEIEEGEEIRELRCNHLFHKDCLDSWISSGSATCPMCRGTVHAPLLAENGSGEGGRSTEVLLFDFCSFSRGVGSRRRRRHRDDDWWLR